MTRPIALVTGASRGIGAGFARDLAGEYDLVLTARDTARLDALQAELSARHPGGRFRTVAADLSGPDGVDRVLDSVRDEPVELLINNAGAGGHGRIVDQPPLRPQSEAFLDCVAVVSLTRALLPGMIERGRGGVINVGSTAGFQPIPTMAVYGASKAFVLSFSQALHTELRGTGVTVVALCPGVVETDFFQAAGANFMPRGRLTVEEVVRAGRQALADGRAIVVPGLANKIGTLSTRLVPRKWQARTAEWIVRPQ